MKHVFAAAVFAALLSSCASQDDMEPGDGDARPGVHDSDETFATGTDSATNADQGGDRQVDDRTNASAYERTERRLQLDRAMDQWWLAFQRQEYAKSDGLAIALEQFVNENFDAVVADLDADNPRFRKVAAGALGFSNRIEAVDPLLRKLRDNDADAVSASLLSLGRLSKNGVEVPASRVTPYLSHVNPDIRSNASLVLVHATKKGQGELFLPLTAAMSDTEPSVRVHAAAALGALGERDALPYLISGLDDPKALVRIRAAYALGRIGDARAVPALVGKLEDPTEDVAKAVHKSLMRITGQEFERRKEPWDAYLAREAEGS